MTMDAYREMAGDALRATRQRGDAAMARYFGDAALAALAQRMRVLRHVAGQGMSSLYKLPQPGANFVDPAAADPSGRSRAWLGAAHPVAGIAMRSAIAASAGARGRAVPEAARAGAGLLLPGKRTAMPNDAPARAAAIFGGLAINPRLRARANNKPAVGNSLPATRLIAGRLIPASRAVSAASGHAGPGAAHTPGFGQTVRPAAGGPAPGHVYLDKNLVGYHLAAVVTAEQTRAAARPNGSGASFNSSMAALRPTGAGL